jgi:C-terminal processing protease CtpA/Prc
LNNLPAVKIGNHELRNMTIFTNDGPLSVFGVDILSHFRVGIDFRRNLLTLEPTSQTVTDGKVPGVTGLIVGRRDDKLIIDRALESKSSNLRMHVGKEILSIDGLVTKGMTIAQAQSLLDGYANTEAVVKLTDKLREVEVKFQRISIFQTARRLSPPPP